MMTKTIKVLEALMNGHRIRVGGRIFCFDENYRLCQVAYNDMGGEKLLIVNMGDGISLAGFIRFCDDITQEEMDIIIANLGLNRI